jgi:hypothetical protein
MTIDTSISAGDLAGPLNRVFELAAQKVRQVDRSWDPSRGAPVFTVEGKYTTRGWTEWTQGFQFGLAILAFDATGDADLLEIGRRGTLRHMAAHVSHVGVHDHAFNNLSTYGNLRRLMREGRIAEDPWEVSFYELAIKVSGAIQAARWAGVSGASADGRSRTTNYQLSTTNSPRGYIYSFNGPHSLFIDTMRTLRILGVAWQLGQKLMHENDKSADLLKRSVLHGLCTNQYLIFHGDSPHTYDIRGRTAHEGIFNRNGGTFRCRSTQQGYSPFSTWTRGLAWAILGFAEELEFFATIDDAAFQASTGLSRTDVIAVYEDAATATAEHYLNDCAAADGIVYWDDGAPGLARLGDWRSRPADPFNDHEPVDSSAAAIAAQGLLRLGRHLNSRSMGGSPMSPDRSMGGSPMSLDRGMGNLPMSPSEQQNQHTGEPPVPRQDAGSQYIQSALTIAKTLFASPYLSESPAHQGLLLHSIYHRPNNWDHVPPGRKIPCGESSMWGDYHLLELAVYLRRLAVGGPYLAFFDQTPPAPGVKEAKGKH